MDTSEKWTPAFGFEGIYEVSDRGRVRRIAPASGARVGHVLKPYRQNGYPFVYLRKDGAYHDMAVHRLVLLSFTTERGECVNHKNGIRHDNRLENLEWCTTQQNLLHATRQLGERRGSKHWNCKVSETQIALMRRLYATGKYRHDDLAEKFGISRPQVGRILNRKSWSHLAADKTG